MNTADKMDLSDKSLDEMREQINIGRPFPSMVVVPPWVAREIIGRYGDLSVEHFELWCRDRFGQALH